MTTPYLKAYVQGDWAAAPIMDQIGFSTNPVLQKTYQEFLEFLKAHDVENTATWHLEAKGVATGLGSKRKMTDVVRNTRQIDQADCVISYLILNNPDKRHWGSLSLMGYAIGRGKPCYIIANPDCVVWQSHFVWHPLIRRFHTVEEFETYLEEKKN